MDLLSSFSSLTDVLHALSQALLVPDIILLLLFAGYALFCIGSIIMEYFTERRNFKIAMPRFLADLMSASETTIPEVVRASGLLNRQKTALLTVYDYRTLPGDALLALVRRTVQAEETRYSRITGRNNTAAKISPMLGLMGTLIPLGPGVAALGQADPTLLSSSLLIAFDTTVAGLAVAAVCMAVGKIRSTWYNDYLSALESGMATLLQKIEDMRADGTLEATEPTDYAFMFEQGLKSDSSKKSGAAPANEDASEPQSEAGKDASGNANSSDAEEETSSPWRTTTSAAGDGAPTATGTQDVIGAKTATSPESTGAHSAVNTSGMPGGTSYRFATSGARPSGAGTTGSSTAPFTPSRPSGTPSHAAPSYLASSAAAGAGAGAAGSALSGRATNEEDGSDATGNDAADSSSSENPTQRTW